MMRPGSVSRSAAPGSAATILPQAHIGRERPARFGGRNAPAAQRLRRQRLLRQPRDAASKSTSACSNRRPRNRRVARAKVPLPLTLPGLRHPRHGRLPQPPRCTWRQSATATGRRALIQASFCHGRALYPTDAGRGSGARARTSRASMPPPGRASSTKAMARAGSGQSSRSDFADFQFGLWDADRRARGGRQLDPLHLRRLEGRSPAAIFRKSSSGAWP